MKKEYRTAEITVVEINVDVIMSSGGSSTTWQPTGSTSPIEGQ